MKIFNLTEKEEEAAEKFMEKHRHKDVFKGAIGGHLSYRFTLTSIGTCVSVSCSICEKTKNITDYSKW